MNRITRTVYPQVLRSLLALPVHKQDFTYDPQSRLASWYTRLCEASAALLRNAHRGFQFPASRRRMRMPLPTDDSAPVLLVVPPFASLWYPSLAAHVLQACVRDYSTRVDVLYANLMLAAFLGETRYEQISAESIAMVGERFFARCAFGLPPLGRGAEQMFEPRRIFGEEFAVLYKGLYPDGAAATLGGVNPGTFEQLQSAEVSSPEWIDAVASEISARKYKIVGCTTTFQQTTASIALLNRVKSLNPDVVTVLGGANCEGEMAEALAALDTGIDYFFSGESEETFREFVRDVLADERPGDRVIYGQPCKDMDSLPFLRCNEFFDQRKLYLPYGAPARSTYLTFETSRGCWWGQKQHCTFCGLNGEGMAFRRKSTDRVIDELRTLVQDCPTTNVSMTDNIMPQEYFKTLVPRLSNELPTLNIFYEQKANLSFDKLVALKDAGMNTIQPGIEALSSRLLKQMRKGVTARQNVSLLRYARVAGVRLVWNLICGFPEDELAVYRETMELIPLIRHLQPPSGLWHLSIDRFSPYFFEPNAHSVSNIRPKAVYRDFLPEAADIAKIAYHFVGDYPSDTHRFIDVIAELNGEVTAWKQAWGFKYRRRPELKISRYDDGYALVDTRGLPNSETLRFLDRREAGVLMNSAVYKGSEEQQDAIARQLAVLLDGCFVPLAVARSDVFLELTEGDTSERDRVDSLSQLAVFDQSTPGRKQRA